MKCELLEVREGVRPDRNTSVTLPDGTQVEIGTAVTAPKGTIVEGPDAWWLCKCYHDVIRNAPRGGSPEHVVFDGLGGQALRYVAKPADQECVDRLIAEGFLKPGTTFVAPQTPPPVTTPAEAPPEPSAE